MEKIKIRSAKIEDADSISKLIVQLGYNINEKKCREQLSSILARPFHHLFLAVDSENIYGMIHIQKLLNIICESQCEVLALVVDEKKRNQGIGTMLLQAAESWAFKQNLSSVKVNSNITRMKAHYFYINHDFQLSKTQHYFEKAINNSIKKIECRISEKS